MSIYSSALVDRNSKAGLTGNDSGDGATQVIPVADGYVMANTSIAYPISGRDITNFVERATKTDAPRRPNSGVRDIKEKYGCCVESGNLLREFNIFDRMNEVDEEFRAYYTD